MNITLPHEKILCFAVDLGEAMLKSGAETYRVEDTIVRIIESTNIEKVDTFVTPTGIMVTISDPAFSFSTLVRRVKNRSTRLDQVELLNQLSRDFVNKHLTLDDASLKLSEIKHRSSYKKRFIIFMIGISSGSFALMFDGGILEFLISTVIGFGIGALHFKLLQRNLIYYFILFLLAFSIGSASLLLGTALGDSINTEALITGCIMPFVPGVAFTNALRDLMGDELLSGISRIFEALFIAVALAAGIGASMSTWLILGGRL